MHMGSPNTCISATISPGGGGGGGGVEAKFS